MKDIPIGEYFTIGNEVYKCVKYSETGAIECSLCDLRPSGNVCIGKACAHVDRIDRTDVMFILYDDTTEDTQQDD